MPPNPEDARRLSRDSALPEDPDSRNRRLGTFDGHEDECSRSFASNTPVTPLVTRNKGTDTADLGKSDACVSPFVALRLTRRFGKLTVTCDSYMISGVFLLGVVWVGGRACDSTALGEPNA